MVKDPTLVWALGAAAAAQFSLLSAFITAILTGRLVPRSAVEDVRADRDKWEQAWHTSQQALTEVFQHGVADLGDRMDANTEGLRLVERVVDALTPRGRAR